MAEIEPKVRLARTAAITGATGGVGQALALRLAAVGTRLILIGRRADRLAQMRAQLECPVFPLALDVRDAAGVFKAFAALPREFQKIDILVNAAGVSLGHLPASDAHFEDVEEMIDTNVRGLTACVRAVLPAMVKRGAGHLVNLGGLDGRIPHPGAAVFGATKAYVAQLSENLKADLFGTGVRVSTVVPALVDSEQAARRFRHNPQTAKRLFAGYQPLRPEDVAAAIHWCIDQPAHVNVNTVELMPTAQSYGPLPVHRETGRK